MRERIYKAYDAVKASEAQSQRAQTAALQALRKKQLQTVPVRRWATVAAAIAVVAVGALAYTVYSQPVTAIYVDGETATELLVNRFDRVVAMETESGEVTASLSYFAAYTTVLQEVLDSEPQANVTVFSEDAARCEAMQKTLCEEQQIACEVGETTVMEQAEKAGLPCGKYAAFLQWQALDPTATVEQAQDMTMREIRERIAALTAEDTTEAAVSPPTQNAANGQGNAHGIAAGNDEKHGNQECDGEPKGQQKGKQKGKKNN